MKITDVFKEKKTLSFEVFPLKNEQSTEDLLNLLEILNAFSPNFINCTYGAGGSGPRRSKESLSIISKDKHTTLATHYTCINNTKDSIKVDLHDYLNIGINHILALRGDFQKGKESTGGDFNYASELLHYIKNEAPEFTIAVSGNPETHINCPNEKLEITRLKIKQDLGADYIMTQSCHNVEAFNRWLEKIRKAGITIPIVAGVLPILTKTTTVFASYLNGISIPAELSKIIGMYGKNPEDFKKAGMEYSKKQISRFMNLDINGLHIFSMNKGEEVATLLSDVGFLKK